MFDLDKWTEIYHTLVKNPLRTILTALGVGWGVFMLVAMLGSGNGLKSGVSKEFAGRATNSVSLWARSTSIPFEGLPQGRSIRMNMDDYYGLQQQVEEAAVFCPRHRLGGWGGGALVIRGLESGSFGVYGDLPEIREIQLFDMPQGRFINYMDIEEKRKVAVIGSRVKQLLFKKDEDPIGENISINGVYFQIVGVFESRFSGERGRRESENIFIPFSSFQQSFNRGDRVDWFAIKAKDNVSASLVEEKVISFLKNSHRVHPDDDRAFGAWNMEKDFGNVSNLFFGIELLIWIVGVGTLLSGVIGVTNIMLVIVKERTKEIGIRRAIGATPWSITSQIVLEAVILTTIAGYCGLLVGVGINETIAWAMDTFHIEAEMYDPPSVDLTIALKALGILVISGALAGLLPASRATSIKPVDALRAE